MPATAISNLVAKQFWATAITEQFAKKSSLLATGKVLVDNSAAVSGDVFFRLPFYKPLTTAPQVLTSNTLLDINNITSDSQIAPILRRGNSIGFEDMARFASGDDLARIYIPQIAENVAKHIIDPAYSAILQGLFASGGALVGTNSYDHNASAATVKTITYEAVAGAKATIGEAGQALNTLIVNSKVFYDLQKAGVVTYIAATEFSSRILVEGAIPFFAGCEVVVNDTIAHSISGSPTTYASYLIGDGALFLGYQNTLRVETDRNVLLAGGTDIIKWDLHFAPHVMGTKYNISTQNPADTVLDDAASWARVYDAKNIGVVRLITQ